MANERFKVPCPSCEASVAIRSSAQIGKKVECPKCKYRFTVPAPDTDDEEEATPKKGDKGKKKTAKKGNGAVIGIAIGVLAVVVLGVGAVMVLGGGDDTPKPGGGGGGDASNAFAANGGGAGGADGEGGAMDPMMGEGGEGGVMDPMMGEGGEGSSGYPMNSGGATTNPTPPKKEKPKKIPTRPANQKDITNLLPGDTVAVLRINPERMQEEAAPISRAFLDQFVKDLFENSLQISLDDVNGYVHAYVGPEHQPFVVMQTKVTFDQSKLFQLPGLVRADTSPVGLREFYVMKSTPIVTAVSRAFSTENIFRMVGLPTPPPIQKPKETFYTLHVYDDNTLMIAPEGTMAQFLRELQPNGYPTFKTELTKYEAPPPKAKPMNMEPGSEGYPPMEAGAEGAPPMEPGSPGAGPPSEPGSPGSAPPGAFPPSEPGSPGSAPPGAGPTTGAAPAPSGPAVPYTSIPSYRTIDPALKKTMNRLEDDENYPPSIVFATILNQQEINRFAPKGMPGASMVLDAISQIKMLGLILNQVSPEKGDAVLSLEYISDDAAKNSSTKQLIPLLTLAKPSIDKLFDTRTTIGTGAPSGSQYPGGGYPGGGYPGSGYPGGIDPTMGEGGAFDPMNMLEPGPGLPGVEGGAGYDPMNPMGGYPMTPGTQGSTATVSKIDVVQRGKVVDVKADILWKTAKFEDEVNARIFEVATTFKGRMQVLGGDFDWHTLAAVGPKLANSSKGFPPGAMRRFPDDRRFGIPYPPEERVSFFAELLPFVGRAGVRARLDESKSAWYEGDNLAVAETWVPEFLVPYYPQSSWRATHTLVEGHSLGATNYVGIAGLGLDAARYDPNNPDEAKKVGMTGYDWRSQAADVKDGLSNTIYIVQAPPGDGRPWIAGGGATLVGVDDQIPDPLEDFAHTRPDGQRGTYALMGDGSVRWIKSGTDPKIFKAMVTRAGGESLSTLDAVTEKIKPRNGVAELRTNGNKPTISSEAPKSDPKSTPKSDPKTASKETPNAASKPTSKSGSAPTKPIQEK